MVMVRGVCGGGFVEVLDGPHLITRKPWTWIHKDSAAQEIYLASKIEESNEDVWLVK